MRLVFVHGPAASGKLTVAPDFPQRAAQRVEAAGGRVDFVALTCAPEVVETRVEAASRQASGKLSSLAMLRELEAKGAFAYPPLPSPAVAIDTGAVAPAEAAQRIRDALHLPG